MTLCRNAGGTRNRKWPAIALAALVSAAAAQDSAPPPAPAVGAAQPQPASEPARVPTQTTTTFGAWTLKCMQPLLPGRQRLCEIFQHIEAVQGDQRFTLLTVAVGQVLAAESMVLSVAMPSNVSLRHRVTLTARDEPITYLDFVRCAVGTCVASVDAKTSMLAMLREESGPARIEYRSASEAQVAIPLSLIGFPQALEALRSSAR